MPVGKRLAVWRGDDPLDLNPAPIAGLPKPWGVLYAHPNPDGSRKSCGNCSGWVRTQSCKIHDPAVAVPADGICGYHIYGSPHSIRGSEHNRIQYVDPESSGLEQVQGGTSCDRCLYYKGQSEVAGVCHAVVMEGNVEAVVEALGCCTRWEKA